MADLHREDAAKASRFTLSPVDTHASVGGSRVRRKGRIMEHPTSEPHPPPTNDTTKRKESIRIDRTRKISLLGLGGHRKKSVNLLPEETEDDDEDTANYDTVYGQNLSYYTREALPAPENYLNKTDIDGQLQRPTMDELRSEAILTKRPPTTKPDADAASSTAVKFGWIEGVLIRCLLNIWGVMLFLRLSWVVAQAGVGLAIVIICLSATVTTLTALSMSAISTNGEIKGGGIYYMISRSLGPEFGGAVGAIFSFANAAAVAMHTVGFAESLMDLLETLETTITNTTTANDVRVIGIAALVFMQCIIIIGTEWESKAQIVLLMILLVAIGDFFVGAFMGPGDNNEEFTKGFVGLNATLLKENFSPDFQTKDGTDHSFFTIFAIFFPAATGITAGANISGDLKDPGTAIPKGTLLAILTTTLSYITFVLLMGAATLRNATGPDSNDTVTDYLAESWEFANCTGVDCEWGSHNSFQIVELMSYFGPIIYAGCFAATLSSALASLVSAPKIFQALCKDKLYPGISIFAKGFRKNNDPFYAYAAAFTIALGFILIADLNVIAPMISTFYMAAYAMVNFCTFHASLVKPLGWRPEFKYYSVYSSGFGFVMCIVIMFLMSWVIALITFGLLACLFFGLVYVNPEVNWGSSAQYQKFKSALSSVQSLNATEDHVKNYQPQILVLSGRPSSRPTLIDLAYLLTKNQSMLVCGHIVQERQPHKVRLYLQQKANAWMMRQQVKGFYSLVDDVDFEEGARCLMQASGVGKLRPNVVLMGYKADWITAHPEDFKAYFRVLHDALDNHLGLCIVRLREGFDYSPILDEDPEELMKNGKLGDQPKQEETSVVISTIDELSEEAEDQQATEITTENEINPSEANSDEIKPSKAKKKKAKASKVTPVIPQYIGIGGAPLSKSVLNNLTKFQKNQPKTTIDIWWLYDDGGLTILLPYILSTRSIFAGSSIRVFALANTQNSLEVEEAALAKLLSKFRIQYSDLTVIPDVTAKAKDSTRDFFDKLVEEYRSKPKAGATAADAHGSEMTLDDTQLHLMKDKINRHLRLRELLLDNSTQANVIVMTLPVPRRKGTSSPMYMAWLECLTRDMPPMLLVRGNQQSVLTYYS